MPTVQADSHYTIMLTKLLEQVPEIEEALRTSLNPINKLLKDEPLTLQDMVDNNDGTYKIMYIVITVSSIIATLTILTTIAIIRRGCKRNKNRERGPVINVTNNEYRNRRFLEDARGIELQ